MRSGVLYGIGVGPGDPDLITVKGAEILRRCLHVFVPRAPYEPESLAYRIASKHISAEAKIHRLAFPMTRDRSELAEKWRDSALEIVEMLKKGEDACFLTLGDPMLYSTYVYLLRALTGIAPEIEAVTIPGITAFSAAAARAGFPIGEGKNPVVVVPTAENPAALRRGLDMAGTVVLMKVGARLKSTIDLLESTGHIDKSVFVSRVGFEAERVEKDLRRLKGAEEETGHLSTILVDASRSEDSQ
jgi:precorrin-2/cobalt-factor-2 C20-methyltransferase